MAIGRFVLSGCFWDQPAVECRTPLTFSKYVEKLPKGVTIGGGNNK